MGRHRIHHLVTTQAVQHTAYSDFRQLAVDHMVRILVERGQISRAEKVITNYEKSAGKSPFTEKLRASCR